MEKEPNFTLQQIAGWPLAAKKELPGIMKVELPSVQRGFVWRPNQIENLWDSLLRGYPIGAFVLSPKANNGSFEMLDGQQRATAICLGFGKPTFRDSQDKIKVFIDLEKPQGEVNRLYIFRVITRSHPWGYRKTDNTKTLTSDNIRKAMQLYEVDDHLETDLDRFFPFDASLPVPFSIFIEAFENNSSIKLLLKKVKSWQHWGKVKFEYDKKVNVIREEKAKNPKSDRKIPELSSDDKIDKRISEIFEAVKMMLDKDNGQKIPALYLDFDRFTKDVQDIPENEFNGEELGETDDDYSDSGDNEKEGDQIENLFIRLNAGGTPLRGEDLNYSILKSKIKPGLQVKIEDACKGFFKSSRFITIAYRLYQLQKKDDNRDALTMRIKPKQFQKTVSVSLSDFESYLGRLLRNKTYHGKTLLEYARYLLEYDELNNTYGLPYLLTSRIADSAPEVMFVYLYRLMKGDEFEFNTVLHRKMIGMITLFMWLGKGEKQRDHAKLLSQVWPCAKTLKKELFWSSLTVQRAMLDGILTPFPSFDKPYDKRSLVQFRSFKPHSNSKIKSSFAEKTNYGLFVTKIFDNRDLILYAQRVFLSKVFKEMQYLLDDTNLPFDLDHISPHRFIHRKFYMPSVITDWYNTNGNIRAWPYSLNRMDQDDVPAIKLDPLNPIHYLDKNEEFKKEKLKWDQFILKNKHLVKNRYELKKRLLEFSFCHKKWAECNARDMKKEWPVVYNLILERNLAICKEWYDKLCIEDLIPDKNQVFSISSLLDLRKWELNPKHDKEIKDAFLNNGIDNWLWKAISLGNSDVYVYLIYNKHPIEMLDDQGFEFGIFEKNPGDFIRSIKIPDTHNALFRTDKKNYIKGNFTLTSQDEESYITLFQEFYDWLKKFPNNKEVQILAGPFIDSLATKYKARISVSKKN